MNELFGGVYANQTVLVTGHTGFKGSWLTSWLLELGARVVGFSLPDPPTSPSNFELTGLSDQIVDVRGDIRDLTAVRSVMATHQPSCVFHLAGQPILLRSVELPHLTMTTNTLGTINVLEAIRGSASVRALVSITTDKVYYDQDWIWGYRENDRLGGHDPYSASKAMAELAVASYRDTFFPPEKYGEHGVGVATVRAGNVIGGGDFAAYRLIPDCMRALMDEQTIELRIPGNVRPWQHVLVPLSGYLALGARLLVDGAAYSEGWNFGPPEVRGIPAGQITDRLIGLWGAGRWIETNPDLPKVESLQVRLSWDKAAARLGWHPVYNWEDALVEIVAWFKAYAAGQDLGPVVQRHIADYVHRARAQGQGWAQL